MTAREFKKLVPGDRVRLVGGHSHAPALGTVTAMEPLRFVSGFPLYPRVLVDTGLSCYVTLPRHIRREESENG